MGKIVGKLIFAKGFKKLSKVQNITQSGHTDNDSKFVYHISSRIVTSNALIFPTAAIATDVKQRVTQVVCFLPDAPGEIFSFAYFRLIVCARRKSNLLVGCMKYNKTYLTMASQQQKQ